MEFNDKIKADSIGFADSIIEKIMEATSNPDVKISGEARKIYEELDAWGIFDDFSLKANRGLYVKLIAMQKYRHSKWAKEHPPKSAKPSKWERVMGRAGRR